MDRPRVVIPVIQVGTHPATRQCQLFGATPGGPFGPTGVLATVWREDLRSRGRIGGNLVGGLVAINFIFPEILGMSSSQLTFIFFRGVAQPPTRNVHGFNVE